MGSLEGMQAAAPATREGVVTATDAGQEGGPRQTPVEGDGKSGRSQSTLGDRVEIEGQRGKEGEEEEEEEGEEEEFFEARHGGEESGNKSEPSLPRSLPPSLPLSSSSPSSQHRRHSSFERVGALAAVLIAGKADAFQFMLRKGRRDTVVVHPVLQEEGPMTEDSVLQRRQLLNQALRARTTRRTGTLRGKERGREPASKVGEEGVEGEEGEAADPGGLEVLLSQLTGPKITSDMQAFKAANPHAVLADFLRWQVPEAWVRGEGGVEAEAEGEVEDVAMEWGSLGHVDRAQVEAHWNLPVGRLIAFWGEAPAIPAARQAPLFQEALAAEQVLHFLETLSPASLLCQALAAGCATVFCLLRHAPTPTVHGPATQAALDQLEGLIAEAISHLHDHQTTSEAMLFPPPSSSPSRPPSPPSRGPVSQACLTACERVCMAVARIENRLRCTTALWQVLPDQMRLIEGMVEGWEGGDGKGRGGERAPMPMRDDSERTAVLKLFNSAGGFVEGGALLEEEEEEEEGDKGGEEGEEGKKVEEGEEDGDGANGRERNKEGGIVVPRKEKGRNQGGRRGGGEGEEEEEDELLHEYSDIQERRRSKRSSSSDLPTSARGIMEEKKERDGGGGREGADRQEEGGKQGVEGEEVALPPYVEAGMPSPPEVKTYVLRLTDQNPFYPRMAPGEGEGRGGGREGGRKREGLASSLAVTSRLFASIDRKEDSLRLALAHAESEV
jgi:hypothetical protein